MTSEILIEQITNSIHDDATISAAIDALTEDRGFDKLEAVLAVAAAWKAGVDAREVAAATKLIGKKHRLKWHMIRELTNACPQIPRGAKIDVAIVPGNVWPTGIDTSLVLTDGECLLGTVTVGAQWMLDRAKAIRQALNEFNRRVWGPRKKKK